MMIVFIILGLGAVLILLLAIVYINAVLIILLRPARPSLSEAYLTEIACGLNEDWCLKHPMKRLFLMVDHKNYINGNIYFCEENSKKFMICLHGYGYNRNGMLKYVDMLQENHYNVVIYDHRGLGSSSGKYITMGYREKDDLHQVVEWIHDEYQAEQIGLLGVSMGASAALMYQQKYQDIDFIIEDCGFADLKLLMQERIKSKSRWFPTFPFLEIAEYFVKLFAKFTYKEVSPIWELHSLRSTPILFIHGSKDPVIPLHHCLDMFLAKVGCKDALIVPNATHAGAIITNKELYSQKVHHFINTYMKPKNSI